TTELAAMNSFYMDYVGLQDGIPEWGQSAFVIAHDGLVLTLSEDIQPTGGPPVIMIRRPDGTASPPIPVTVSGRRVTLAAIPPDVTVTNDPNAPTVVYIGRRTQVVHEALMLSVRPTGDNRVEFQAVNMDSRVYLEDDMGPDQVILTSRLYPIEFSDGIAPGLVEPGVSWLTPPTDSVGIGLLPPAIYRRDAVKYWDYKNTPPESIGVGLVAPTISRSTVARYLTYENAEPEQLNIGLLPPAIFRKKVADYLEY